MKVCWVLDAGEEMSLASEMPQGNPETLTLIIPQTAGVPSQRDSPATVEMWGPRTFYGTCAKGWYHVKEIHKLPGLWGFPGGSVVSWGHQESDTAEAKHTRQPGLLAQLEAGDTA